MYRSPIEILTTDIRTQVDKGLEEEVFKAVVSVGINVDKEELIRALQYDRHQYSKGYHDAMDSIVRCENCTHCAYTDSLNRDRGYCGVTHLYVKPTDFCSHGERISNTF
jgi:hypothetical protein